MPSFGHASNNNLITCCYELQGDLNLAIKFIDFSVITGARSKGTQNQAVEDGASTLIWPHSKHNITETRS